MSNATEETLRDVVTAIGNIVNAVAGLVGVKGKDGATIASAANPLQVLLYGASDQDSSPLPLAIHDADGGALVSVASPVTITGVNTNLPASNANPLPMALGAADPGVVALLTALLPPGSHTPVTPSDSTDVTAIATIGLRVTSIGGGASLTVRGKTTSSTSVTIPVVAGQYVYGQFSRVMAATTATVVALAP